MRTMLHGRKPWLLLTGILIANISRAQLTQKWEAHFNGTGNSVDGARSLVVDNDGNVYVTGSATGTGTGLDYRTIKYGANGQIKWKALWNGKTNGDDDAFSIALDHDGNVYVTGRSDEGTREEFATVKYDADGTRQWSVKYAGWGRAIAVDEEENVYVTGEGAPVSGDPDDYVTIKYNKNGDRQWVARYDGAGKNDAARALFVDKEGNVYVTGTSPAGLDPDEEDADYATVKYNKNGQPLWVSRYDGPAAGNGYDEALALTVDGVGNVYVTGRSDGGQAEGRNDYATVKYDANGNEQWAARYNGPGNADDEALALAVDALQNVYVTGFSAEAADGTNYDYATIKYNQAGNEVWVRRYNGPANDLDQATSLALDTYGNIFVTGRSKGTGSGFDLVTVKYNRVGVEQAVARYNGPGNSDDGTGIFIGFLTSHPMAVDKYGNVYVTGMSTGTGTGFDITTIKYAQPFRIVFNPSSGNNTLPGAIRVFVAPNPASVSTRIFYDLPEEGKLSLAIYDMLGRKIKVLDEAARPAGSHFIDLDVATLQSGMYAYQVLVQTAATSFSQTGMITLLK